MKPFCYYKTCCPLLRLVDLATYGLALTVDGFTFLVESPYVTLKTLQPYSLLLLLFSLTIFFSSLLPLGFYRLNPTSQSLLTPLMFLSLGDGASYILLLMFSYLLTLVLFA